MMTSRINRRMPIIVYTALLVGSLLTGCDTNRTTPSATTTAPPAFPYPQFEFQTDVAVDLKPPMIDAAKFALEMSVDNRLKNDPSDDLIDRRFRSRIGPEADITGLPAGPDNLVGETGGALQRAVGARQLPDGKVEVTICSYDTPGLYAMSRDGELIGPNPERPYSIERPLVQWTNRPAADGSIPDGPRWLWVGEVTTWDMTREQIAAVCETFKPKPFIQKMPDPTTSVPTPTPTG